MYHCVWDRSRSTIFHNFFFWLWSLISVSAVLISFGALFQSLGASILKLSDANSFLWSSFLEWQPCNSPLMVFYLFRAIYLGFSQCSIWIMPVFLCPISMYYFLIKYCYYVSNHTCKLLEFCHSLQWYHYLLDQDHPFLNLYFQSFRILKQEAMKSFWNMVVKIGNTFSQNTMHFK